MVRVIGVLLLLAGLAGLIRGGITYQRERHDIDLGAVEVNVTERRSVPIPPILGGAAALAGLALIVVGGGSRRKEAT